MLFDQKKQALIQSQLTLRAIIWDVAGSKQAADIQHIEHTNTTKEILKAQPKKAHSNIEHETAKLDRELELFAVKKIFVGQSGGKKAEQKYLQTARDSKAVYQDMKQQLHQLKIAMKEAVLVTDDSCLAYEVYYAQPANALLPIYKRKPGMAVVFYEDMDRQEEAAADFIVQGFEEIGIQFFDRVQKRRNGLPWNILYTKRTCVREITMADLDELYEIYQAPNMTDYIEPLYEREMEEAYTKSYIQSMYYYYGYGMWVVQDKKTGKLIGRAGIEHRDQDDEVWMELGYVIRKEYQNQGYATEVCMAVLDYAKQELKIDEMHCFIYQDNQASIQVANKLGFVCVGNMENGTQDTLHFLKKL